MKERTMVNIYSEALERSITGTILSMIRFMSEKDKPLTIIGADIYKLTNELASDFCNTLQPVETKGEQEIQEVFKEGLLKNDFNKSKYKVKRIFNLIIEGEDVVERVNRLVGDIRHRNGTTILGRFGFFNEKNKEISEFPVSCPSCKKEAESQIELFWNKYKHLGGPVNGAIKYPEDKLQSVNESVVIIKPNAFEKSHDPRIGDVIDIFSRTGMFIIAAKIQIPTREQMEKFYAQHKEKHFFEGLIDFMSGRKSLALLYEGINAREEIRKTAMTIIRDNYTDSLTENTVHTSENEKDFIREKKALDFETNILL